MRDPKIMEFIIYIGEKVGNILGYKSISWKKNDYIFFRSKLMNCVLMVALSFLECMV